MESAQEKLRSEVTELYESRPYPPIGTWSLLASGIRWEERQTLNYKAAYAAAYGSTAGASVKARILVAGCGTFEPVVVALANPEAEIVAVDLSGRSLRKLEWNIRLSALGGRVSTWKGDVEELPESFGAFDFVVASGLIHHFPDPAKGLRSLAKRAGVRGVFRLMVYSKWGRALLYGAKALAAQLGVRTPAEFRRMIDTLPADHPYKVYFYLYSDARTDSGLADGYLHPCDRPFTALGLRDLLAGAGIEASAFLHAPSGQPEAGGIWERLQVLEALGELQENFRLFARSTKAEPVEAIGWEWNEALPGKGRLYSHLLGKELTFDTSMPPSAFSEQARAELAKAFFLLPGGTP